ncbi:sulfatase [Pseudonocardia zijingensis]|uniref:Phosphoglycerol transferase MdoB-like AlkP superfamily enzyme n=1 Tax=Pseudonocardia zijingensis TaxID=153376 RepID=A0ABN1P2P3_9PSEU
MSLRRVITVLAALLVLALLVAPNTVDDLTPAAFLRLPLEALAGVAVVLLLPARTRRPAAVAGGVVLGLLTVLKLLDMGFTAVLARPFDPVLDWALLDDGLGFLGASTGPAGEVVAVVAALALTAGVLALVTAAVVRLARVTAGRRQPALRAVAVLAPVWLVCAALGVPVASAVTAVGAGERALQVRTSLLDQETFTAALATDPFRAVPGEELLTALRGKDVVFAFVESYGRSTIERPDLAGIVVPALDTGAAQLASAGFAARSGFLTAPVAGGSSWLAHATMLSGTRVANQARHDALMASDRLTLISAFAKADWRTVAVMPGTTGEWPEARFYGHQQVYDFPALGYRGPDLGWASVPDQYTMSAFEQMEHARADRKPLLAEIALASSHAPWPIIPPVIGWDRVGDGSIFQTYTTGEPRDAVWAKGSDVVSSTYARSIAYSLETLTSWVQASGDDDLVLVVLGDHQAAPFITGPHAGRDVPISIITRDPAVLDRISGWGWEDGLRPGPDAPGWPMEDFRDRFLTTFGPDPAPVEH